MASGALLSCTVASRPVKLIEQMAGGAAELLALDMVAWARRR